MPEKWLNSRLKIKFVLFTSIADFLGPYLWCFYKGPTAIETLPLTISNRPCPPANSPVQENGYCTINEKFLHQCRKMVIAQLTNKQKSGRKGQEYFLKVYAPFHSKNDFGNETDSSYGHAFKKALYVTCFFRIQFLKGKSLTVKTSRFLQMMRLKI